MLKKVSIFATERLRELIAAQSNFTYIKNVL